MCNNGSCGGSPGDAAGGDRPFCRVTSAATLAAAMAGNREWAAAQKARDPSYFTKLASDQAPDWLWIGCSDSRVPANELMGMGPGEVFVQRNVGNLATHKDMNVMSCLEYGITALKVKHIIVCGHYGCGAVKAALTLPCKTPGLVNLWIQDIREVRNKHADTLEEVGPATKARWDKLVELNVGHQVFNVCTSPVVQQAWDAGQPLAVHGLVYSLEDGLLKEITPPITSLDDLEHYAELYAEAEREHALHRAAGGVARAESFGDMRRLTASLATHMGFEKLALSRPSIDAGAAAAKKAAAEAVAAVPSS